MEANTELDKAKKAFNDANTASNEYSTTVSNYETAMGTVEAGSANAAAAVLALSNDLQRAGDVSESTLQKQVDSFRKSYDEMKDAASEKGSGVTNEMVAQAQAMWLMAQISMKRGLRTTLR